MLAVAALLAAAGPWPGVVAAAQTASGVPFIDAHTHLMRHSGAGGGRGARGVAAWMSGTAGVSAALAVMNRYGIAAAILAPPPLPWRNDEIIAALADAARQNPTRLAFSAGGGSLESSIVSTQAANVTPEVLRRFEGEAEAIAGTGAAAFGELAAEHFSSRSGNHPYISVSPDHPLLLALADIAAKYGMPIELHMEAVTRDMPFPDAQIAGPPNPATVHENIAAFERLLDHNRAARIVWVHAGWDLTGERTVPLMRRLLERHPNLYMTIKSDKLGTPATAPFLRGGGLKPGWLAMLQQFPDRFVVGSDQFYSDPGIGRTYRARLLVDALPAEIVNRIASENVKHIYRLPTALR
jgi:predicted TIM-barrel fold metal-dependent hydrolase